MPIVIKCKLCGTVHESAYQIASSKDVFFAMASKSTLNDNRERCPKCNQDSVHFSTEYFWQDS